MKRLTSEDSICIDCNGIAFCKTDCMKKQLYDKLKYYEDAEEKSCDTNMRLFRYYGNIYGENIAGIVKAKDKREAKQILVNTYDDYNSWHDKTLREVTFDVDGICEVFYG